MKETSQERPPGSDSGGSGQDPVPTPQEEDPPAEAAFPDRKGTLEALRRHLAVRVAERRAAAIEAVGDLLGGGAPDP